MHVTITDRYSGFMLARPDEGAVSERRYHDRGWRAAAAAVASYQLNSHVSCGDTYVHAADAELNGTIGVKSCLPPYPGDERRASPGHSSSPAFLANRAKSGSRSHIVVRKPEREHAAVCRCEGSKGGRRNIGGYTGAAARALDTSRKNYCL